MKRVLVLFLVLSLILVSGVSATTYYVSNDGNDGNDGRSIENAWQTIEHANDNHVGGDTIYVLPGEYREEIIPQTGIDKDHRTIYSGYSSNRSEVKIIGSDEVTGWTQHSGNIYVANFSALSDQCRLWPRPPDVVEDLTLQDCNDYYGLLGATCSTVSSGRCVCGIKNTNCFEDRQRWLTRVATNGNPWDEGSPLDDENNITGPGQFFYDSVDELLYVWSFDNQSPENHVIECSQRQTAYWSYNWSASPHSALGPEGYVIIQNLTIMQSAEGGIILAKVSPYISIINNEFAFNGGWGYCFENPAAIIKGKRTDLADLSPYHIKIIGNKIHDQYSDKGPRSCGVGHCGAGIELYGVNGTIIENNEVYNVGGEGIYIKSGYQPLCYHNITIRNNTVYDTSLGIAFGIGGADNTFSGTVENNLVYNTDTSLYTDRQNNVVIRGNTLWNANDRAISIEKSRYGPPGNYFTIKNNVVSDVDHFWGDGAFIALFWGLVNSTVSDFNIFFDTFDYFGITAPDYYTRTFYDNISNWQSGTGQDMNSLEVDPLFVDPDNFDFRLQSSSPAIDAGEWIEGYHCFYSDEQAVFLGITQDGCRHWSGVRPDIGAFEFEDITNFMPPVISEIDCLVSGSWVDCSDVVYGDTLESVRANCSSFDDNVVNAIFSFNGLFDNYNYFSSFGYYDNGFWVFNNPIVIDDSGDFRVSVNCIDSRNVDFVRSVEWFVGFGFLSVVRSSPFGNVFISNNNSFVVDETLSCIGGECGDVVSVLNYTPLSLNKPVFSSGVYSSYVPELAVDSDMDSFFQSNLVDAAWWYVDLENQYVFDSVNIYWNGGNGDSYEVQVSSDNVSWTTVFVEPSSDGTGLDNITFDPVVARYVRMQGVDDISYWGYAFYEFEVFYSGSIGGVAVGEGDPFYSVGEGSFCPGMKAGDSCDSSWVVFANGSAYTYPLFSSYVSSYSGVLSSPSFDVFVSDSACPEFYNEEPCNIITNQELGNAVNAWFRGNLGVSGLIEHLGGWRNN